MASGEGLLSGIRLRSHRRFVTCSLFALDSLHFPAPYPPNLLLPVQSQHFYLYLYPS